MIGVMTLTGEAAGVAEAAALGILLGIYYDLFRILRRVFCFRYATIVFQDLFFFITSAIPIFFAVCWMCGGIVRIYIVGLVLLSAFLYCSTFGTLVVFMTSGLIKCIGRAMNYVYCRTLRPVAVRLKMIFVGLWAKFCKLIKKSDKKCAVNKKTS